MCMHFAWGVRVLFLMLLYRCIPLEMRLERMRPPYVDAVASPRAADILFIYGVTHHKKTKSTRYKVLAKDYAATMQQACTRAQFAHHHGCPQLHTRRHTSKQKCRWSRLSPVFLSRLEGNPSSGPCSLRQPNCSRTDDKGRALPAMGSPSQRIRESCCT